MQVRLRDTAKLAKGLWAVVGLCLVLAVTGGQAVTQSAPAFGWLRGNLADDVPARSLPDLAGLQARPHLSFNGTPGLIDMPTAHAMPDGDIALTLSSFGASTRGTLAFQVMPSVTGVFRYARIDDFNLGDPNAASPDRYDRSFDVVFHLAKEGRYRPAIAVGLRDFGGTDLFASEYLVASKTLPGRVTVTAGLGWGRLATSGAFSNPLGVIWSGFETRPSRTGGLQNTGQFDIDRFFRGDAALFGGVHWQATRRLALMAEYSSDAYRQEENRGLIERKSSLNFGASYRASQSFDLGLYYLYGSEVGVRLSYILNPKVPAAGSGIESAPVPVAVRPARAAAPEAWTTNWTESPTVGSSLTTVAAGVLTPEGLVLESLDLRATEAHVTLRNTRFDMAAQAVGRAARALTLVLPASIETFHITLVQQGMPTTRVSLRRSDLEDLEFAPDNAWRIYGRAQIADAGDTPNARSSLGSPKLTYGVTTALTQSLFDPEAPFLFDVGLRAEARYEPRPGLIFAGRLRQPLYGNRDSTNRISNSVLPLVRSESDDYGRGTTPKLEELTATYLWRPGPNLYARATAGYLELAFVGVSGELLWKPPTSRLALGVELNAVHQREPGDVFALGTNQFDNDAITGHASAYYSFENGFYGQLDVGRYLAGDWGATFTLTRRFTNGWEVGAFFTLTDVSFEDFGEGAFDKGILLTIPTSWGSGQPSREARSTAVRPVLRDGGARVNVSNRLYDLVRTDGDPEMADGWGRFWR